MFGVAGLWERTEWEYKLNVQWCSKYDAPTGKRLPVIYDPEAHIQDDVPTEKIPQLLLTKIAYYTPAIPVIISHGNPLE